MSDSSSITAVILAGGKGTRLRPYTIAMPKPLVAVGEYPILEILIRQLEIHGVRDIILAVNHQAAIIQAYFGNGERWNVNIQYALETKPLGTMGPLYALKDSLPENFLVLNGDILTDLNFGAFYKRHCDDGELFTICAHKRVEKIDYGILHVDADDRLTGFEEKPSLDYLVSMGIYAVNKRAVQWIPPDTYFGFDHLMLSLIEHNERVCVSTHPGYWNDIGRPSDYEQAILDIDSLKETYKK